MRENESTQIRYPWRATMRTLFANIIGVIIVIPLVTQIVIDGMNVYLPPNAEKVITLIAGFCAAFGATITRIMAIPQVNQWLTSIGLGTKPKE